MAVPLLWPYPVTWVGLICTIFPGTSTLLLWFPPYRPQYQTSAPSSLTFLNSRDTIKTCCHFIYNCFSSNYRVIMTGKYHLFHISQFQLFLPPCAHRVPLCALSVILIFITSYPLNYVPFLLAEFLNNNLGVYSRKYGVYIVYAPGLSK